MSPGLIRMRSGANKVRRPSLLRCEKLATETISRSCSALGSAMENFASAFMNVLGVLSTAREISREAGVYLPVSSVLVLYRTFDFSWRTRFTFVSSGSLSFETSRSISSRRAAFDRISLLLDFRALATNEDKRARSSLFGLNE